MSAVDLSAVQACPELIWVGRRTGVGDCRVCGFHGRPVDHLAYSVARGAGLEHRAALTFAAVNRRRVVSLLKRTGQW